MAEISFEEIVDDSLKETYLIWLICGRPMLKLPWPGTKLFQVWLDKEVRKIESCHQIFRVLFHGRTFQRRHG